MNLDFPKGEYLDKVHLQFGIWWICKWHKKAGVYYWKILRRINE